MGERITRREFVRRSGLIAAVGVTAPSVLAACAQTGQDGGEAEQNLLERAREQGFIRVGFANERPFGFASEAGELTGEAPEVARAVFAELGIPEVDGVLTEFGSLIPGLNARRFDVIAAGMFINPERCEEVVFSDPDYCSAQAFAVEAGNPLGLNTYADVAENDQAELGVLRGAVEVGYAEDSGVAGGRINAFPDPNAMIEGLAAGRVNAIALTSISIRSLVETADDPNIEMTEPFVPVIDGEEVLGCGGYGFRGENQAFRDEFNGVLNEMKENGEILPIVEEFGFGQEELDLALDHTADSLCSA